MIIARTLIRRLLVGVVVALSFFKLAVARIAPTDGSNALGSPETSGIKTGRIVRVIPSAQDVHYVLEATGVFPYVRFMGVRQHSAPVPVEVAPVPAAMPRKHGQVKGMPATRKRNPATKRRPLTRRMQMDHEKKPFCYPANSQSCYNCPECCIVCGGCSGCSGCSGCGGCTC